MKVFNSLLCAIGLALTTVTVAVADPLPIDHWAIREVIQSVEISPDGKRMALMKNASKTGDPIIEIYDVDNMGAGPTTAAAGKMEIVGLTWVSDDYLLVNLRAKVRKRIEGFNRGVFAGKNALLNVNTLDWAEIGQEVSINGLLPNEPDTILISTPTTRGSRLNDDVFASFVSRAYYKLDLKSGSKNLIFRGGGKISTASFDAEGNPRLASGYDRATREFIYYTRQPGEADWNEAFRQDSYDLETFNPVGFDDKLPHIAYVVANNGNDKAGLWEFNTETGEYGKLVYRRPEADVAGIRGYANFWAKGDGVTGVTYFADRIRTEWFDEEEKELYDTLRASVPNAHRVSVTSMSRDGDRMIVVNSGPQDPGTYYLVKDGTMALVGSRNPLVKAEDLSPIEYVKWTSRDGTKTVPGYLTVPKGDGPHPLIVLPHGGPFVSEVVGYDEWGQFLANNGYMVLQPQYRGSLGYGLDHFTSALNQGGLAMQDDKDDGALYLVEQGRVDRDRIAMFGWSYGGYAALVAGTREDNIYQCTIAGAAVSDPNMQLNYYRDVLIPAQEEFELRRREGIQPIDEVAKLNIPMLMIHGRVDQRVPYKHMQIYEKAVKKNGKDDLFKAVTLDGADHFYNTLYFEHQEELYTEMLDFLQNDCGPGGL